MQKANTHTSIGEVCYVYLYYLMILNVDVKQSQSSAVQAVYMYISNKLNE